MKFIDTEILNQNSYEVISDGISKKGIKLNPNILNDIKRTLDVLL